MRRLVMILGSALCIAAPAGAQSALQQGGLAGTPAQTLPVGSGWQIDGGRDNAFVYDSDLSAALVVNCYEDSDWNERHALVFGVPDRLGPSSSMRQGDRSSTYARAINGVTIMIVETRDAGGRVTSSIRMPRLLKDGMEVWQATLTKAELGSVRGAARLDIRTNHWSVAFTGNGSSRRIGELSCHQN